MFDSIHFNYHISFTLMLMDLPSNIEGRLGHFWSWVRLNRLILLSLGVLSLMFFWRHSANLILACFFLFLIMFSPWCFMCVECRLKWSFSTFEAGFWFEWPYISSHLFVFFHVFGNLDGLTLVMVLPNIFFAWFHFLLLCIHFDLTFIHTLKTTSEEGFIFLWMTLSCMGFWASKIIHCFLIFLLNLMSVDWHSNKCLALFCG